MLRHLIVLVVASTALAAAPARADQAALEQARQLFWEARFEDALAAADRAEQGDDLTREDLIALYELRAQIERGQRDRDGMRAALERLAAVDPDHEFGRAIPPDIVALFDELRADASAPIAVDARAEPRSDGAVVHATAAEDPLGLVREVRVHARQPGGEWQTGTSPLETGSATVEYYAEAVGPGGAVIASAGTADAPRSASVAVQMDGEEPAEAPVEQPSDDGTGMEIPWLWVGAGAGAVALLAIVIALLASGGGDDAPPGSLQPSFPMQVEF